MALSHFKNHFYNPDDYEEFLTSPSSLNFVGTAEVLHNSLIKQGISKEEASGVVYKKLFSQFLMAQNVFYKNKELF